MTKIGTHMMREKAESHIAIVRDLCQTAHVLIVRMTVGQ